MRNWTTNGNAAHIFCIQQLSLMKKQCSMRDLRGPALGIAVGLYFGYVLGQKAAGDARSYALAVGLIVLSGFLMLVSWVRILITTSSAWAPVWRLLTGTIWIAGCGSCTYSSDGSAWWSRWASKFECGRSDDWHSLLGVETVGCLIWLQMTRASQRAGAGQH
jgi:hypothetical protein